MNFIKKLCDKVKSIFSRKKTLPEPVEAQHESNDEKIIITEEKIEKIETTDEKTEKIETSSKEDFKDELKKIDGKFLKMQILQQFKANVEELYLQKFIDMGASKQLFNNFAVRQDFIKKEEKIIKWLTEKSISKNESNLNRLKDGEKYSIDLYDGYYAGLESDFLRDVDDVLQNNDNTVIENDGNKLIRRRIDRIYTQGKPKTEIDAIIYELIEKSSIVTQRYMHSGYQEKSNGGIGLTSQEDISKVYDLNGNMVAYSSVYKEAIEPEWYTDEALNSTLYLEKSKELEKNRAITGIDESQGVEFKRICRVDSYKDGTYFSEKIGDKEPTYAMEIMIDELNSIKTKFYKARNICVLDKNSDSDRKTGFYRSNNDEAKNIRKIMDNGFIQNVKKNLQNNKINRDVLEYKNQDHL